jgi:hypothetical protein
MLARHVRSPFGASDRDLCVAPSDSTVEIRHTRLKRNDTWMTMSDQTLACASGRVEAARPITPRKHAVRGPMALFRGGASILAPWLAQAHSLGYFH